MTISSTTRRAGPFVGNSSQTAFPFAFKVFEAADMLVVKVEVATNIETTLVLTSDYTVALNPDQNSSAGGTVNLNSALATGYNMVISSKVAYLQGTDLTNQGGFYPEVITDALDRLTIEAQQLAEGLSRSAQLPITSAADAAALVADIVRIADSADNLDTVATNIDDVNTVADDIADVTTVAANITSVNTVAGIDSEVTTVAGIDSDVTAVAGNEADISTVAGISSDVSGVADISAAVSAVNSNASNINTVAGINAAVTTVSGINAAVSTVSGISSAVSTVSGISSAVSTVSGNSANVTTVAGISSNVTTVAGIQANVTTVAGVAANVTTVAGISSAVTTVATNSADVSTVAADIADINDCADNMAAILDAPAQASAAAASAAAAAASLDNFDDRYLGAKASAPTLDNDGNALVAGALYFNNGTIVTDDKGMWVYDGGTWIAASAASQAILVKYKYIATAGQTSFSGSDANALTLAYTVGSIIVTLNGAVMNGNDYTASTGSSVVLGVAAALNDEIGIFAFSTFDIANTYTQAQVDAFAVKLTGDQTVAGVKTFSGATTVMNGNVGIGTSSPTGKVDIASTSITQPVFRALNNGANWSQILCGYNGTSVNYYDADTQIFRNGATQTERMRIDSSGNLLVGTTGASPFDSCRVAINANQEGVRLRNSNSSGGISGTMIRFLSASNGTVGEISATGSTTTYATSSDYRLKENVQPMTGALSVVQALNPVTYNWKADGSDGQGFIAHELQAVVPDCVVGEKDAVDANGNPQYQGIDTSFLVATLTAAIKEQQAIITSLTERITALEGATQ